MLALSVFRYWENRAKLWLGGKKFFEKVLKCWVSAELRKRVAWSFEFLTTARRHNDIVLNAFKTSSSCRHAIMRNLLHCFITRAAYTRSRPVTFR